MKSTAPLRALCGLCLMLILAPAQARATDALTTMFTWWNQAFKTPGAFTAGAFRRYFTDDAAIVLNGKESARGIPALVAQFQRIQANSQSVEIVLPFREGFVSGNKIFTYHFIRSERAGRRECLRVMGYAVLQHGKIALVNFLRIPEDMDSGSADEACRPPVVGRASH
jgi:hypothetical protein